MDSTRTTALEILENGAIPYAHVEGGIENGNITSEELNQYQSHVSVDHGYPSNSIGSTATIEHGDTAIPSDAANTAMEGIPSQHQLQPKGRDLNTSDNFETAVTALHPPNFPHNPNPTSIDTFPRAVPHPTIITCKNKGSIQNSQNSIPDSSLVPVPVRPWGEREVSNQNAGKDTSVRFDVTRFSSIVPDFGNNNASDLNSCCTIHLGHQQQQQHHHDVRENSIERTVPSDIETSELLLRVTSICSPPSDIDGHKNQSNTTTTTTTREIERRTESTTNLERNSINSEGVPSQRLSNSSSSSEQAESSRCSSSRYGRGSSAFEVYKKAAGDSKGSMRMDSAREESPHRSTSSGSLDEKMDTDGHQYPNRTNGTNGNGNQMGGQPLSAFSHDFTPSAFTSSTTTTLETASAQAEGIPYASSTGQPPTNETNGSTTTTAAAATMASAAMGAMVSSPNVASLTAPHDSLWGAPDLSLDWSEKKESAASNVADRKGGFSAEASPTSRSLDTEATASTSTASWVEQDSLPSQRVFLPSAASPSAPSASQTRRADNLPIRKEKSPVLPPSYEATTAERTKDEAFKRRSQSWDEQFAAAPAPTTGAHFAASSYHRSASGGIDRPSSTSNRNYPPVVKAPRSMLPQSQHQPSPSRGGQVQQQWAAQQQHQMLMPKGTSTPTMQSWTEQQQQQQQQRQRMPYQPTDDSSLYPHSNDASPLSSPSLSPRMTSQLPPPLYPEVGLSHDQQQQQQQQTGPQFTPPRFPAQRDNTEVPIQHIRELVPPHRSHQQQQSHRGDTTFHSRHQQQYTAQPHHHIHAAPSAHQIPLHQRMGSYGHHHHHANYSMAAASMGYAAAASGPPPAPSSITGMPQQHMMHGRTIPHGGLNPTAPTSINPSAARSPPEILKTLLRKKACLYETGTSRAIALATWLVGRRLALAQGYFSRQQLQSGVHAAASSKIDNGVITRTKVNRCMQIILNSCFHYIIPRPDGSEEKGDVFQKAFAERAVDDGYLLRELPPPWDDVVIDGDLVESLIQRGGGGGGGGSVDKAGMEEEEVDDDTTPPASGRGRQTKRRGSTASSTGDGKDGGGAGTGATFNTGSSSKRAVLLCFNENVRSAEDVFRCHNEFIRDAAHSANLQLTTQDWRAFFLGEDVQQQVDLPTSMQLPSSSSAFGPEGMGLFKRNAREANSAQSSDVLGCMAAPELSRFRTSWCSKRYDHDPALCFFAHVEINRGWLRRDPRVHNYAPEMCPHIKAVPSVTTTAPGSKLKGGGGGSNQAAATKCFFNTCPDGANCAYAHSKEEIDYHPERYKKRVCNNATVTAAASGRGTQPSCPQRDICPLFHPPGQQHAHAASSPQSKQHYPRHGSQRRGDSPGRGGKRHAAVSTGTGSGAGTDQQPSGAPMFYVRPAPKSDFEASLMLPGLRDLFRRHSSTLYALHCGSSPSSCNYSNFGDDWGLPDIRKSGE